MNTQAQAHLNDQPNCPCCGAPMRLYRELPELGDRPALMIFECTTCREFETQAPELQRSKKPLLPLPLPL